MSVSVPTDGESGSLRTQAHPPCPVCGEGFLLPLGMAAFWVCSTPSCTYTISAQGSSATYYKGHAVTETKEKGEKRWVEFKF